MIHSLDIQLCSDADAGWQQFKQQHVLAVLQGWHHDLCRMEHRLDRHICMFTRWALLSLRWIFSYITHFSSQVTMELSQVFVWVNACSGMAARKRHWVCALVSWRSTYLDSLDIKPSALRCSNTVDFDTPKAYASWGAVCGKSSLIGWCRRSPTSPDGRLDWDKSSTSWSPMQKRGNWSSVVRSKAVSTSNALLRHMADLAAFRPLSKS